MSFYLFKERTEEMATEFIRYEMSCFIGTDEDMKNRILDEAEISVDTAFELIENNARLLVQIIAVLNEYDVPGIKAVQFYYRLKVDELYDDVFETYMHEKQEALEVRFPTDISGNIMSF